MISLPWYQFAAFLDATSELDFASSHVSYLWQRILGQIAQSTSSNELDIGSLDATTVRDPSQGLILDASIQASLDGFQDSRFKMIPAFFYTRGERSANHIPSAILDRLSVLPENTGNDLERTTQSSIMQMSKIFMFLLSNNHLYDSIKDPLGDKTVLKMARAFNGLQYKHLFSHGGPTSEALLEKIFCSALRAEDVEVCRITLDNGVDPNKQGFIGTKTPLQFASDRGNVAIASMLINAGADLNRSLLPAALSRKTEMFSLLLAKGAHASPAELGEALEWAVFKEDIFLARSLLAAGADVTWADEDGFTALHLASENSMVKILLQAGADVNAVSDFGTSVLEHVVCDGSTDAIQSLLDEGPEIFGNAVYLAVNRGNIEILQILLNAGANTNACFEESRRTALTRAVEKQSISIVKILLESGADVNGCTLEHELLEYSDLLACRAVKYESLYENCHFKNHTPLQAASVHQDTEIARMLIEAGANINMDCTAGTLSEPRDFETADAEDEEDSDFYGTAVQIAAGHGNMELVRLLCRAGANVNAPAYQWGGRTALQAAIKNGDRNVIGFLLAAGADVNAAPAEKDGITALAAAIMSQDPNLLSSMFKAGASPKEPSAGHSGVTALAAATANCDVRLVQQLLHAGVNPVDTAALQAAAANDDIDLVRILLLARANSNDHGEIDYGYMALYQAALDARYELVEILLASKIEASVRMSETTGCMSYVPKIHGWIYDIHCHKRSPWWVALMSKDLRLIRIFLEAGADPNQSCGRNVDGRYQCHWRGNGHSCLQWAVIVRHLQLMQMLLEAGADVNVDLGPHLVVFNTTLGYAAHEGQTESVRLLLKAGADPNIPAHGASQRTALQAAAEYGHEDVVDILLEAGADVNIPPSPVRGVTALQVAAIKGYLRIARVLIQAGADVNAAAAKNYGRTALEGAAEYGRIDMLQYLLNNGASIDGAGRAQYESAIHYAAASGHLSACNLLKSHHRCLYGSS